MTSLSPMELTKLDAVLDLLIDGAVAARLDWRKHKNFHKYQTDLRYAHGAAKAAIADLFHKALEAARLEEAKLARNQFIESAYDSDFIITNGERIAELELLNTSPRGMENRK